MMQEDKSLKNLNQDFTNNICIKSLIVLTFEEVIKIKT